MQVKNLKLVKIIISIFISTVLILACSYIYNNKISNNYIEEIKKEAEYNSYTNAKIFDARVNSITKKLEILKEAYLKDITEITPENKEEIYKKISNEKHWANIYSYEEFKQHVKNDEGSLDSLNSGVAILYTYDEQGIIDKIEIAIPIFDGENIIGAISGSSLQDEFHAISNIGYQFYSYIFKKDGDIILGNYYFENENIYKTLENAKIKEKYSIDDIKTKVEEGKPFSLIIEEGIGGGEYLFFMPLENDLCIVEMTPLSFTNEKIKEASKLIGITLFSIILIIFLQIAYLTRVIIKQNKDLLKIESERIKEMQGIINSVPGGVIKILCNENIEILFANSGFYNLTGYTEEEYKEKFGNNQDKIIFKNDLEEILDKLKKASTNKENINFEYRIIKKNGELSWISLTGEYLEEEKGYSLYQCIAIDLTAYKGILEAFEIEKEQYKIVSEISDEIIFEYYMKTDYIQIPDKYKETFAVDLITQPFIKSVIKNKIIHKDDLKEFFDTLRSVNESEGIFAGEIRVKNNFNEYNWAFYQGVAIKNSSNKIDKIVGKISNIDKFKKEIEELKEKSNRDPLTKVYNKVAIENIVNSCLEKKDGLEYALFIIDIDNFKSVNDTFGHIFGDAVLKEITSNITKVFNEDEIIARIGGDEFVVFLKNITDIDYIIKKATTLCDIFRKTYMSENKDYKISASVGIAISPKDGIEYSELLEKADIAVYTAKKAGKDQYKIYNEDMKNISLLDIQKVRNNDEDGTIKRKSFYENILIDVSEMFLKVKDIGTTINLILSTLCKNFDIERAYVFEISEDEKFAIKTYEWYEDEMVSKLDENDKIEFNEKEFLDLYNGEPFLYYEDMVGLDLNNDILVKYFIKGYGIKSFFTCYFMEQGKIKGYVGLESYNNHFMLKNDDLEGAFIVCRLIGGQILKDKTEKKFDTENQINQAIVSNQQLYTYIVKEKTFEILYLNDKFKNIVPNADIGEVCYKAKGYDSPCHDCPIQQAQQAMGEVDTNTSKFYCEFVDNWLGVTSTKIKWIDKTDAYLVCYRDISEYIEQINYIDPLTGAATLNKFNISAKNILNNTKIEDNNYAVLYMDIDKFKYINDTFGYTRGDEVLKEFAIFLNGNLDESDIFCRTSDDRFISLIKYKNEEHFTQKIKYIYAKLEEMQNKLFKDMNLTIICGIYKITEDENDLNYIIDRANIARKSIKGSHQNSYAIYTEEMNEATIKEKLIEGRMKYGLENNEFFPYLQPKFNLFTREVCGAEALVRWKQNNGKMIYPNDFIPIFEKNGFIIDLDFYLYEEIFKKIREWIDKGIKPIPISLNVSRAHIKNLEFVDKIVALIEKYEIPYEFVELELTESIFSANIKDLKEIMEALALKGFKLSIDDFGSAYSSLNLLKDINVDIIKLDKGFLYSNDILESNEDFKKEKVIVEYVVKMAKEIGLNVICEGIETESQIQFLKEIGCEMGQGYVYSKPIEIEEFEKKYLF